MTLILGASCYWYSVLVSDRLVTLQTPHGYAGDHDVVSNKSVVLITADGLLLMGYTGTAYLAGMATDDWIAEQLWGERIFPPAPRGPISVRRGPRPARSGLNGAILCLRKALAATPHGDKVKVLATGFRIRRRRFTPINLVFGAWGLSGKDRDVRMRPPSSRGLVIQSVGANPTETDVEAAFEVEPAPTTAPEHADWLARVFRSVIRRTASNTPTVGRHVMTIIAPPLHRRQLICRFEPDAPHHAVRARGAIRVPVAFSPWIITDFGFNTPMAISGMHAITFDIAGWSVIYEVRDSLSSQPGSAFFMEQPRPLPPGTRGRA